MVNRMAIKPTLNNLTIWLSSHQTSPLPLLLLQIPALKMTLLYLYRICTYTIIPSPRLSIMWSMLLVLKQSSLPLDVVLTKPQIIMAFPRSLLSPTLFMQQLYLCSQENLQPLFTSFPSLFSSHTRWTSKVFLMTLRQFHWILGMPQPSQLVSLQNGQQRIKGLQSLSVLFL